MKFLILYTGMFLCVVFGAIAVRIFRMSDSEYKKEQNKVCKKSLYLDTKKNKWVLW